MWLLIHAGIINRFLDCHCHSAEHLKNNEHISHFLMFCCVLGGLFYPYLLATRQYFDCPSASKATKKRVSFVNKQFVWIYRILISPQQCKKTLGKLFTGPTYKLLLGFVVNSDVSTSFIPNKPTYDDVMKWKHFPPYWPFVRGIHLSPVNSPQKRPVTRSFDVYFDLRPNKRLSKQSLGWWFETLSLPLWRHRNDILNTVLLSRFQSSPGALKSTSRGSTW